MWGISPKRLLELFSAICAAIAAILWFLSGRITIPNQFPITVTSVHAMPEQLIGAQVISTGSSEELDDLARAIGRQSKLSAWAAIFASATAAFQFAAWFAGDNC